jgi:hypothetical protein
MIMNSVRVRRMSRRKTNTNGKRRLILNNLTYSIEHDEYTILTFGDSSMSINGGNERDGYRKRRKRMNFGSEQNRYELFRVSRTSINRIGIRTFRDEYKLEELWG